jgi:membrane protease YdiL (CAAX protease family)
VTAGGLLIGFLSFLGNSAVLEEPAFRGFLWGYLEDFRWKPIQIWLLQAAMFLLAHLRYIDRPFTFLVAVPAAGLLFGWLSWKSRSIAASLVAHAAYNSIATYF